MTRPDDPIPELRAYCRGLRAGQHDARAMVLALEAERLEGLADLALRRAGVRPGRVREIWDEARTRAARRRGCRDTHTTEVRITAARLVLRALGQAVAVRADREAATAPGAVPRHSP